MRVHYFLSYVNKYTAIIAQNKESWNKKLKENRLHVIIKRIYFGGTNL